MSWKRSVNVALTRATGYELRRVRPSKGGVRRRGRRPGDRLVRRPTFVLCSIRSGSTLLRMLLDSHSQLHSPHEIHLRYISVSLDKKWSERSMREMGLDARGLRHLLWDRLLDRELASSGKPHLVTKTPSDVFIADEIKACWPDARFIFLLRHPAMVVRSRARYLREDADLDRNIALIRRYCVALENARSTYDGLTVRYEDLASDPRAVTQRICAFLGVPWEAGMLDYGEFDHGRMKVGLGDWRDKIKSGEVQPPEPLPAADEVPEPLREVAAAWGYIPARTAPGAPAA